MVVISFKKGFWPPTYNWTLLTGLFAPELEFDI